MKKTVAIMLFAAATAYAADEFPKPYSAPCTERENVFAFTEKPTVKNLGNDKYEIAFAVKGYCDVTVGLIDEKGIVARHLASGVLGANAPVPFQKNSLKQTIYWNGKDDMCEYHKTPEKLRVQVRLGLKPEFDKRLGSTNPKLTPGIPWGIACDENGVYVAAGNKYTKCDRIRKFDHDGNYVCTISPPPANLPPAKLEGMGFTEYEAGRKDVQSADLLSVSNEHTFIPRASGLLKNCQFAIVGGRIYYSTTALSAPVLHYINTDGSTDLKGAAGRPFLLPRSRFDSMCMAASWDGKWVYMTSGSVTQDGRWLPSHALYRASLEADKTGEVFVGDDRDGAAGSDNSHFQNAEGLDCDGQGRIYVCDNGNNRIQVFTPDGKHAKTIPLDRPLQIKVHRKTGALYVNHDTRVNGKTVNRLSKLTSYDNPTVEFHLDGQVGKMALDSWTAKPRVWFYAGNVRILEEAGKEFRQIADFAEEEKMAVGAGYHGWIGLSRSDFGKVACDPKREQVYYQNRHLFDLKTGAYIREVVLPLTDDIAFDKRGYMHCHFRPDPAGVGRLDPARPQGIWEGSTKTSYGECPYDYGVEQGGWRGVLPVMDQPGACSFQHGIGVNMRGDVAENCQVFYVPKRDDEAEKFAMAGFEAKNAAGQFEGSGDQSTYGAFQADIQRKLKLGEEVNWIRPKPGIPMIGATIWTWERNGELREKNAVIAGRLINGVMLDEDGAVYFVCDRTRQTTGRPFLGGNGGIFGIGKDPKIISPITGHPMKQPDPFTGTLVKVRKKAEILSVWAPIPMEEKPTRPPEFADGSWIEGAEWLYAGASPIVLNSCVCPTMRFHTDWYKRTFVPEQYRHAIGVVDTAGNLILHIGQYGNFDSGYGPGSKIPVGGDGIAFSDARMVSGTDNYLCFTDRSERIIVLKLNYHAEETVGIGEQ